MTSRRRFPTTTNKSSSFAGGNLDLFRSNGEQNRSTSVTSIPPEQKWILRLLLCNTVTITLIFSIIVVLFAISINYVDSGKEKIMSRANLYSSIFFELLRSESRYDPEVKDNFEFSKCDQTTGENCTEYEKKTTKNLMTFQNATKDLAGTNSLSENEKLLLLNFARNVIKIQSSLNKMNESSSLMLEIAKKLDIDDLDKIKLLIKGSYQMIEEMKKLFDNFKSGNQSFQIRLKKRLKPFFDIFKEKEEGEEKEEEEEEGNNNNKKKYDKNINDKTEQTKFNLLGTAKSLHSFYSETKKKIEKITTQTNE